MAGQESDLVLLQQHLDAAGQLINNTVLARGTQIRLAGARRSDGATMRATNFTAINQMLNPGRTID